MVLSLQEETAAELYRRRHPEGQQAGIPHMCGVPVSVLMRIERDCRFALSEDESICKHSHVIEEGVSMLHCVCGFQYEESA